jgi:hypothetical protein
MENVNETVVADENEVQGYGFIDNVNETVVEDDADVERPLHQR